MDFVKACYLCKYSYYKQKGKAFCRAKGFQIPEEKLTAGHRKECKEFKIFYEEERS
jgi:hypothetical protein